MDSMSSEAVLNAGSITSKIIEKDLLDGNLIAKHYLTKLFLWMLIWFMSILGFIWVIDPYGVSPFQVNLSGINIYKPKRIDIDRLIKPYEVWRYQPKTIFLGTSRIHQSIDPTVFNGTQFAPAYNAAVPASTLSQNAAILEEYFRLDKNLKNVFIELFIYNFIFPQPEATKRTLENFLKTTTSLLFSADSVLDSIQTISFNQLGTQIGPYIGPHGNWIRPESFNTKDTFNQPLYISTIVNIHKMIPDMLIQPSAMDSLNQIVEICKKHKAKLYMMITPSYPWDDYRLLSLGYWPLLEEWIKKMSVYENVFSFSQYNSILEEPAGEKMKWWNDPIHFGSNMGHLMLQSFIGMHNPEIPINLLRPVKTDNFMTILQERRSGLNTWIDKDRQFAKAFDFAKMKAGNVERKA